MFLSLDQSAVAREHVIEMGLDEDHVVADIVRDKLKSCHK